MSKKLYAPELTDLRAISRDADKCLTIVTLGEDSSSFVWLKFGQLSRINVHKRSTLLRAYLPEGTTDFEHDSAYLLSLPVIGLAFDDIFYHQVSFSAWVDPNGFEDFRVPRPGYNPLEHPNAVKCPAKECSKEPHIIVPEGHYAGPPPDVELFRAVAGKRVTIMVGPSHDDTGN